MKIYQTYGEDWSKAQAVILKKYGFIVKGFTNIEVDINNTKLIEILNNWDVEFGNATLFEKSDSDDSNYFWVNPAKELFTLITDDTDLEGDSSLFFNFKNACKVCEIGKVQSNPLQFKTFSLNNNLFFVGLKYSLDDDFLFVKTELKQELAKKFHIETKIVLNSKGQAIEDYAQIVFPIAEHPLNMGYCPNKICPKCKTKIYTIENRGFLPSFNTKIKSKYHLFQTQEFFGASHYGHRKIYCSREFHDFMKLNKQKLMFYPTGVSSWPKGAEKWSIE